MAIRRKKLTPEELNQAHVAAYEDLICTCESDIGQFRRDDLSETQNVAMWEKLEELRKYLAAEKEKIAK